MAHSQADKPDQAVLDEIRKRLIETGDWDRCVWPDHDGHISVRSAICQLVCWANTPVAGYQRYYVAD
jgi:hypothetical protein